MSLIFPTQCVQCGALVQSDGGLCADCWRNTPFILGLGCDQCGAPLMGEDPGVSLQCDDCRAAQRPWERGRAVLRYDDGARRLVLALKHGDRLDLVPVLAQWMATRAADIVSDTPIIVPVPLHWWRMFRRRYNQSAELGRHVARRLGLPFCPDALARTRPTATLEGKGVDARFAELEGCIHASPKRVPEIKGNRVLLIDDVMTSGATLAACTEACFEAGARSVSVLVLARVCREV